MHDGESIQSALCPWMSRFCVLYVETSSNNSMKQRSGLLLDAVTHVGNYSCKWVIIIMNYVERKGAAYQLYVNIEPVST